METGENRIVEPDVLQYTNYRVYLRDYYEFKKKTVPAFSLRFFAEKAGLSSHAIPQERKFVLRFNIAHNIPVKLVVPKCRIRLRTARELATVLVPETPVHKNRNPIPLYENIRRPRQIPTVKPIAEPSLKKRFAHNHLGLCILRMDRLHHLRAGHRLASPAPFSHPFLGTRFF